jgi:hypothetical protein
MSGTGASNLGYGNIAPLSNINGRYVNVDSSNSPANFGSNEIPGLPGLAGAKSNIDAAAGKVPGICLFKGGSKGLKRKIKNITKKYKMKGKSLKKRASALRRKIKRRMTRKSRSRRSRSKRYRQRGGYDQYQNNLPLTHSYSVGGILSPSDSALASPPPINVYKGAGQCIDNYNHYTNKGFPSRGH